MGRVPEKVQRAFWPAPGSQEPFRVREHWGILLAFAVLALAVRLPYLQQLPAFIESNELRITLDCFHRVYFPLNDFRPYLGALLNYITAACFHIVGLHTWVPRAIIVAGAAATIPLTLLLGGRLVGRSAAVIGATMMTACVYHVSFLSHVAWPNSLTPFFTTAMMLCFVIALQEQKPQCMLMAAFLFGLALQTHPSAITLAPALLLLFFLQGKDRVAMWLRKPLTYAVIPAFGLGYLNMVIYNIQERMPTLHRSLKVASYAVSDGPDIGDYLVNTKGAWMLLLQLLSSSTEDEPFLGYLFEPLFLLCIVGIAGGLVLCLRKRKFELPAFLLIPMLIIPAINEAYDYFAFGRYLGFLIPVGSLLVGCAADEIIGLLRDRFPQRNFASAVRWGLLGLFFFGQLGILADVYADMFLEGDTTEMYCQIKDSFQGYDRRTTAVVVDPFAFKSTPIRIYLELDGWNAEDMARRPPMGIKRTMLNRFVELWNAQDEDLHSNFHRVVAVLSPLVIERLLHQDRYDYEGCVVEEPDRSRQARILTCYHAGRALFLNKQHAGALSEP